ncbi:MAG: efflux RND transporter permease subunit, partial [Xanthomonadales bacterium]|nr:efflux RND transporter permease subunit [Xanthomonadales bacterium]
MASGRPHLLDRVVRYSLNGGVPLFLFILAVVAGLVALQYTPREEEPQIVVPMVDVLVSAPGLSSVQVERQVTIPVEKLLTQIPGVEHVYSNSLKGRASVTLRFYVGQDREEAILNTYNKLYSNQDLVPGVISEWLVRPVEVDDVPIVLLALWSDDAARYDDYELRRIADEVTTQLQGIPRTSEVKVSGGRPRAVRVLLDPESLAARKTTALEVVQALTLSNVLQDAGTWTFGDQSIVMEGGDFIRDMDELGSMLVNVIDGMPIYLSDVAKLVDGPAEPENYSWIEFAPGHPEFGDSPQSYPMVTISVAKNR